jgi:hypothetical protein
MDTISKWNDFMQSITFEKKFIFCPGPACRFSFVCSRLQNKDDYFRPKAPLAAFAQLFSFLGSPAWCG